MAENDTDKEPKTTVTEDNAEYGVSTEALGVGAHGDVEIAEMPVELDLSREALGIGVSGDGDKAA